MGSSLNSTPRADRVHIAFFGLRNAGKSSLVNAFSNQEIAVVSDTLGTTTDPVYKSMELLPIGPIVLIDTPGYDDEGELGEKRIQKTLNVLSKTDLAVLVTDASRDLCDEERELIALFGQKNISYITVCNKCDLSDKRDREDVIYTSATEKINIDLLKIKLSELARTDIKEKHIFDGLLEAGDIVVLITPIDASAPKGRLILPQVQSIRDVLDNDAICVVTKENTYEATLKLLGDRVKLAVCDSQVFKMIEALTPESIELTSFSILMARLKGYLDTAYEGIKVLDTIKTGDRILISEGCSHHRQCGDIGTVKLPKLIKKYTGAEPVFEFTQGVNFPSDLSGYKLIIHCGGCMLNEREVQSRMNFAIESGVPFSNYGIAIAYMNGIMERCTSCFSKI